jgi:hypothetical protein
MSIRTFFQKVWPFADHEYEEAETENLLRDHDAAKSRFESSNDDIITSQNKLLESIRMAKPDQLRQTVQTMLERTKWGG